MPAISRFAGVILLVIVSFCAQGQTLSVVIARHLGLTVKPPANETDAEIFPKRAIEVAKCSYWSLAVQVLEKVPAPVDGQGQMQVTSFFSGGKPVATLNAQSSAVNRHSALGTVDVSPYIPVEMNLPKPDDTTTTLFDFIMTAME